MSEIEAYARKQVVDFLRDAVEQALDSYNALPEEAEIKESQKFKALHDARKAAIAHIRLLIELAKREDSPEDQSQISQDKLSELIDAAKKRVAAYEKENS